MTISYPLYLPTAPGISNIKLRKVPVVGLLQSPYSGAQQVQVYPGQWWEADIELPTMRLRASGPWEAFLAKLNGMGPRNRGLVDGTIGTSRPRWT